MVLAQGLPEAGVPLRGCRRPGPCRHQRRDPRHSLHQRQGVLHLHVHVLQVETKLSQILLLCAIFIVQTRSKVSFHDGHFVPKSEIKDATLTTATFRAILVVGLGHNILTDIVLFSVMWQESRIWTNNSIEEDFWYPVSLEFLDLLWIPNIFIYNLKSFSSLQVLKRLAGENKVESKQTEHFS